MTRHLTPWLQSLRTWQHHVRFRPAFPFIETAHQYVTHLQDALRFAWADDLIESIETYLPGTPVAFPFAPDAPRGFVRHHTFSDAWFAVLHDVNVSPVSGLAWRNRPTRYFVETAGDLRPAWVARREPAKHEVADLAVVASQSWNAFHFLIEVGPLLAHVRAKGHQPQVIIPQGSLPFVEEAVKVLFGVDVPIVRPFGTVRVARLLASRRDAPFHIVRPEAARKVRDAFLSHLPDPPGKRGSERVYVSRRRAAARRIENEDALEAALVDRGFTPIDLTSLTFPEQVAAFRNAHTIVGLHGAGLTHMLWGREGARLIEVLPWTDRHGNNSMATLALGLGFRYDHAVLEPSPVNPYGRFAPSSLDALLD